MQKFDTYDEIVLGGGKGGKSLALALAAAGRRVALIEQKLIGGSCINVACIPTKTLVTSAKLLEQVHNSKVYGLDLEPPAAPLAGVIARKRRIVGAMVEKHEKLFKETANLDFIYGAGHFVGKKEIQVDLNAGGSRSLGAERIYINTGSRTTIPSISGLENVPYLTSTSIMELETLPQHLAIVGGGYIALEFAQIFRRLGSKVTVLLRSKRFLPNEDPDIADAVKAVLAKEGIEFVYDFVPESTQKKGEQIQIESKQKQLIDCSHLLIAIGRTPNTEKLNLSACGVELDERGHIKVNDKLETKVPGVWALGDCNGGPLFTHVSWDDYRIVKANVLNGENRSTKDRLVPYTLFIDPELGRVGLTEEQARAQGLDIVVAKIPASAVPRANTSSETEGVLKAVVDRQSGQILGCSLFCHSAGEVMSVLQMAMLGKLPYQAVRDTIFTHPTMAESLNLLFAGL